MPYQAGYNTLSQLDRIADNKGRAYVKKEDNVWNDVQETIKEYVDLSSRGYRQAAADATSCSIVIILRNKQNTLEHFRITYQIDSHKEYDGYFTYTKMVPVPENV